MADYRVTVTGFWNNLITCQNVLAFHDTAGGMNEQSVANEIRDGWLTLIKAGQTNTFIWKNISVLKIGSNVSPLNMAIAVQGVDQVSNHGGTQVVCVKWRIHTQHPGPRGRGRIYLPAFRDVYWLDGQLTTTGVTNITAVLNSVKARYVGVAHSGPMVLGVHGRGPEAIGFLDADDLTLSLTPGVQRRRNLNVGI